MTLSVPNIVWRASTAAEAYNAIKGISDAFTAVGFVKHTDTGQIDLSGSTVTLPTTPSTVLQSVGYEIRKLVASGKPTLYCRIDYGVSRQGNSTTPALNNYPTIRMQWSLATDGAGNLQGGLSYAGVSSAGFYSSSEAPSVTPRPFFIASDGGNYLSIIGDPAMIGSGSTSTVPVFPYVIERSRDALTGAYDSDGFIILRPDVTSLPASGSGAANVNNRHDFQYCVYDIPTQVARINLTPAAAIPAQGVSLFSSSLVAGQTPLFPITVMLPQLKAPMGAALAYYTGEITSGSTFVTNIYGVNRTFVAGGLYATSPGIYAPGSFYRLAFLAD